MTTMVGNMEVYGVIYKITNKVNGKVYIGQTIRGFNGRYFPNGKGIERVYKYYKYCEERKQRINYHLVKSIEKYGFENFNVNKVFDIAFSKEELDIKERIWIKFYNATNNKYGYNIQEGGNDYLLRGEKSFKSIFTEKEVLEIKRLKSEGYSTKEIKNILNINDRSISSIVCLRNWVWLGTEYNDKIQQQLDNLRKTRVNVNEYINDIYELYEKGMKPLDICMKLNFTYNNKKNENFDKVAHICNIYKHRKLNLTKFCEVCGEEFCVTKKTKRRKYCLKCKKEAYRRKDREKKRKNRLNKK